MRSSMYFQRDEFRLFLCPGFSRSGGQFQKHADGRVLMAGLGAGKNHLLSVTPAVSHQTHTALSGGCNQSDSNCWLRSQGMTPR